MTVSACEVSDRIRNRGILRGYDYGGGFEVHRDADDDRTAEQWARAVFESAPATVRTFLVFGWRAVLALRLGPLSGDASHVLGWRIQSSDTHSMIIEQDSWLIDAVNVVEVETDVVRWTTLVRYRQRWAWAIWMPVLPEHQITIPRLLSRASRHRQDAASA